MHPLPLRCGVFVALALGVLPPVRPQGAPFPAAPGASRERAAPSWNGRYTGDQLALELNAPKAGAVAGTLTVDGQSFPLIALVADHKLVGTVQMAGDATSFEATLDGETLRCVIGGAVLPLKRVAAPGAVAAAPVARVPAAAATAPAETGQLVKLSGGGSFRIPTGWTHQEETEGVMLLPPGVRFDPNQTDNPEVYVFATRDDYDPAEEAKVVRDLSAAVALSGGSGGQRRTAKFGPRDGVVYQWEFRDPASGRAMGFNIHLAAEGTRAMVIIAMGEGARLRASDAAVRQILSSVTLAQAAAPQPPVARATQPQPPAQSDAPSPAGGRATQSAGDAPALADSTPLAQRWLAKLRGMMVRQFWASQGMSSDKRHFLNADGTYAFRSSSMVSVDVSGASGLSTGRDSSTGRWKIRDISGRVFLEVSYNDGNVRRMAITEDNRNWYLNGEKAFAVKPE